MPVLFLLPHIEKRILYILDNFPITDLFRPSSKDSLRDRCAPLSADRHGGRPSLLKGFQLFFDQLEQFFFFFEVQTG